MQGYGVFVFNFFSLFSADHIIAAAKAALSLHTFDTCFLFVSFRTRIISSFICSSTTSDRKMLSTYSWIACVFLCYPSRRIQDGYATHEDQILWLWHISVISQSAADSCNITSPLLLCLPALTHKVSAGSSSVPTQTSIMHSCFSCT